MIFVSIDDSGIESMNVHFQSQLLRDSESYHYSRRTSTRNGGELEKRKRNLFC